MKKLTTILLLTLSFGANAFSLSAAMIAGETVSEAAKSVIVEDTSNDD